MTDSRDGPLARQKTLPESGSSQARSKCTPSSRSIARSRSWASFSCSAVTPKKPEWTSMKFAIVNPLCSSASTIRTRQWTRSVDPRRRGVISRMTDDLQRTRPTLAAMHTSLRAVRCPLLVGRDDLVVLADQRLDDVIAGRGKFLLLAGEAGIGKTRLLAAIQRKAEARGFSAVAGALAPQDHDVPAASILDLARSMTRLPRFAELGRELLDLCDSAIAAGHVPRRQL